MVMYELDFFFFKETDLEVSDTIIFLFILGTDFLINIFVEINFIMRSIFFLLLVYIKKLLKEE